MLRGAGGGERRPQEDGMEMDRIVARDPLGQRASHARRAIDAPAHACRKVGDAHAVEIDRRGDGDGADGVSIDVGGEDVHSMSAPSEGLAQRVDGHDGAAIANRRVVGGDDVEQSQRPSVGAVASHQATADGCAVDAA